MPKKKYLVIGSSGHQFVDCIPWDIDPLPNIVDYDVIIANVRSISDDFLKKVPSEKIEAYRKLLTRFLISDGTLIIVSDFFREVKRGKKYPDHFSNYAWCPIIFGFAHESGTSIDILENKFPKYFTEARKWDYYFFLPSSCLTKEYTSFFGGSYDTKYKFSENKLIKNRYNKMLSGEYSCEVYYKRQSGTPYSKFEDIPDKVFGKIILLPLLDNYDSKAALNFLLEDLFKKPQVSLPPDWVEKIKIPSTKKIDLEIKNKLNKNNELRRQLNILFEKRGNIESYKKLIYSDGKELEDIFKKCLIELGSKVEPAKYSSEEYCLVYKGIEYPVEAKGVSKSISLTHLRQLIDYMLKYEEETEKKCKGILLGNPWKNIPIDKRNTTAKPNFPQNVIDRAKDMNIPLVSSVEFFKAFCSFLDDKKIGHIILDKIVGSAGIVSFKSIKKSK